MKLTIRGHYVTIFNSKDETKPAGLNVDGVFVGKYPNLDQALEMAETTIFKIQKAQAV